MDMSLTPDRVGSDHLLESGSVIFGIAFALAGIAYLDVGTIQLMNFDLAGTAFTVGGLSIQWASILSAMALIVGYASSNISWSEWGDLQSGVAYLTLLSIVVLEISPPLYDWVLTHQYVGLGILLIQVLGYAVIAGMSDLGGDQ